MKNVMLIDYEYCSGCHTCEIACQQEHGLLPDQYGIKLSQIGPDQLSDEKWQFEYVPIKTDRCDGCARRRGEGKLPSCVQHCQSGVIYYGSLEEMTKEAATKNKFVLFG